MQINAAIINVYDHEVWSSFPAHSRVQSFIKIKKINYISFKKMSGLSSRSYLLWHPKWTNQLTQLKKNASLFAFSQEKTHKTEQPWIKQQPYLIILDVDRSGRNKSHSTQSLKIWKFLIALDTPLHELSVPRRRTEYYIFSGDKSWDRKISIATWIPDALVSQTSIDF